MTVGCAAAAAGYLLVLTLHDVLYYRTTSYTTPNDVRRVLYNSSTAACCTTYGRYTSTREWCTLLRSMVHYTRTRMLLAGCVTFTFFFLKLKTHRNSWKKELLRELNQRTLFNVKKYKIYFWADNLINREKCTQGYLIDTLMQLNRHPRHDPLYTGWFGWWSVPYFMHMIWKSVWGKHSSWVWMLDTQLDGG